MDFLYAGVLVLFATFILWALIDTRRIVKKSSKYHVPDPFDLGRLFQYYLVLTITVGFILYFIFR